MELVKKTKEYQVFKKRSGRYGVRDANKAWVNGEDKTKILLKEGLIKLPAAKPKPAEPATDAPAEGGEAASE